jgi:hypothetical protein
MSKFKRLILDHSKQMRSLFNVTWSIVSDDSSFKSFGVFNN